MIFIKELKYLIFKIIKWFLAQNKEKIGTLLRKKLIFAE